MRAPMLLSLAAAASGAIVEETVQYPLEDEAGTTAEGFIVYDTDWTDAPAVIVVHQWLGLGDTEKMHARDLAARGFVGFAIDMYGAGCRGQPCGPDMATILRVENPQELRRRAGRGLEVLKGKEFVDVSSLGANGYCFGGTVVLEMARAGMGLGGVVSFHGGLVPLLGDSSIPPNIAVQVHTGDLDPITENDLDDMNEEMRSSQLEYWASFIYGNCAHGWTDPASAVYRQREGEEAHEIMFGFYPEVFNPPESTLSSLTAPRNSTVAQRNYTEMPQGHAQSLRALPSAAVSPLERERQAHAKVKAENAELRAQLARLQQR